MALRTIRMLGDEILTKKCREVKVMNPRTRELIDDMLETMYDANGVGLAAPQVGVLRRVVVIDIGEGPLIMVNPVILETEGEQTGDEGCLSLPGKAGQVTRPNYVKARFFDENMEEYEIEAEELLARAICHELDHLDGHMYVEKVEGEIHDVVYEEPEEEDSEGDEEAGEEGDAAGAEETEDTAEGDKDDGKNEEENNGTEAVRG